MNRFSQVPVDITFEKVCEHRFDCYSRVLKMSEFDHLTVDAAVRQKLTELILVQCHVITLITAGRPYLLLWSILVLRIGQSLKKIGNQYFVTMAVIGC